MKKCLPIILLFALAPMLFGQGEGAVSSRATQTNEGKTLVFRFLAEDDMFYIPWQGNGDKLQELLDAVEQYKSYILEGTLILEVEGYSSALPTTRENLQSAAIRANRVKTEMILQNGIQEEHFRTSVYAEPHQGWKSVVVVTLPTPVIEEAKPLPPPVSEAKPQPEPLPKEEVAVEPAPQEEPTPQPFVADRSDRYRFALRTNLLYDAALLPTLGVEWRPGKRLGIVLDVSGSHWGKETGRIQKMWVLSPEVRYYMDANRRLYLGLAGNYGEVNLYKGLIGGFISGQSGFQGEFWNAGLALGYQLRLCSRFSLDFNLGVGYNRFSYDKFKVIDEVRVFSGRDLTKNLWGVTQAGISLLWHFGSHK